MRNEIPHVSNLAIAVLSSKSKELRSHQGVIDHSEEVWTVLNLLNLIVSVGIPINLLLNEVIAKTFSDEAVLDVFSDGLSNLFINGTA